MQTVCVQTLIEPVIIRVVCGLFSNFFDFFCLLSRESIDKSGDRERNRAPKAEVFVRIKKKEKKVIREIYHRIRLS